MHASKDVITDSAYQVNRHASEYDAINEVELPFGEKIALSDNVYTHAQSVIDNRVRDAPSHADTGGWTSQTDQEDYAQDDDVQMTGAIDDESDESLLHYARTSGLTTDYLSEHPLQSSLIPTPPASALASPYLDDAGAHHAESARLVRDECANERWNLDKNTADFLASVTRLNRPDPIADLLSTLRFDDLRIVEPVLPLDPEIALARLRARNAVKLSTEGMKACSLNTEKGQSLSWSAADLRLPSEITSLLHDIIEPPVFDHWKAVDKVIPVDQPPVLRREQIPLLPASPELRPCEPATEAHEMELTSTPDDLLARDAADAESRLLEEDSVRYEASASVRIDEGQNTSDAIAEMTRTPVTSSSSPLNRKRPRDLRAETPVLYQDPDSDSSAAKRAKTSSFPTEMHTVIPDAETDGSLMDLEAAHEDVSDFLANVVTPLAQSVIDEATNEKLDELDTTLRVAVPLVDAVELLPPWFEREGPEEAQTSLLSRIGSEIPQEQKKWSGISKLEKLLPWTPFPRYLGKLSLHEQFDDGSCERYTAGLTIRDDDSSIDVLLWKPEGLRLLDPQDSDDEDLEADSLLKDGDEHALAGEAATSQFNSPGLRQNNVDLAASEVAAQRTGEAPPTLTRPPSTKQQPTANVEPMHTPMQALLQKRKLELQASSKSKEASAVDKCDLSNAGRVDHSNLLQASSMNPASHGLRNFLGLQGAVVSEIERPRAQSQVQHSQAFKPAEEVRSVRKDDALRPPLVLPNPTLLNADQSMSVVVSSSTLTNRQLIREIQSVLPQLDLIERDSAQLTSDPASSSKSLEADFSISPGVGLMHTTLQKMRQRPLPGQRNFFGVRERIASVCRRYESCIVLVSEGAQDGGLSAQHLDERDAAAFNELVGHTTNLEAAIEVIYIPGRIGELARWIAACISRHRNTNEDAKLLHEETLWELVLRAAGANAVAAQTILVKLKQKEFASSPACIVPEDTEAEPFGLPAFVRMSVDARVQRFGPCIGGDSLLRRMSEVIEGRWMSASG